MTYRSATNKRLKFEDGKPKVEESALLRNDEQHKSDDRMNRIEVSTLRIQIRDWKSQDSMPGTWQLNDGQKHKHPLWGQKRSERCDWGQICVFRPKIELEKTGKFCEQNQYHNSAGKYQ